MDTEMMNDRLASITHQLITEYVRRKAEDKSGEQYEKFKNNKMKKDMLFIPQNTKKP